MRAPRNGSIATIHAFHTGPAQKRLFIGVYVASPAMGRTAKSSDRRIERHEHERARDETDASDTTSTSRGRTSPCTIGRYGAEIASVSSCVTSVSA